MPGITRVPSYDNGGPKFLSHNYNEEAICIHCGLDGAEAKYYSDRGYSHEYPDFKKDCPNLRRE